MRLKSCYFIFCLILFTACSATQESGNESLYGTWNWIGSSGGIDGRTETPETTGRTMALQFSKNVLKKYNNGNLIQELPFSIQVRESIIDGAPRKMLIYEEQSKQSFNLSNDTLTLFDECYDCFVSRYIRSTNK